MKDKPWKKWKTRKVTLICTILVALTYVTIGIYLVWMGKMLDATLTDNFFDFCKWVVISGCAITIAKVGKGKTNSDSDENLMCEEEEEINE